MENFTIKCRRAALLFVGWTLVSIIFAGISYAAAVGENNKEFGFVSALRLNLVQFYVWAILSPVVFRFSRRFPVELRPLNVRNLLLYFPALISFAGIHQVIHLAVLWSITSRWRQKYPALLDCRQGAAQSSENAASSAFSFQHASLDLVSRFRRPSKSKQHDRATR